MEPLAIPPQWGWTDEAEARPAEWWSGEEPAWQAPELPLDEVWVFVLDGDPVVSQTSNDVSKAFKTSFIPILGHYAMQRYEQELGLSNRRSSDLIRRR